MRLNVHNANSVVKLITRHTNIQGCAAEALGAQSFLILHQRFLKGFSSLFALTFVVPFSLLFIYWLYLNILPRFFCFANYLLSLEEYMLRWWFIFNFTWFCLAHSKFTPFIVPPRTPYQTSNIEVTNERMNDHSYATQREEGNGKLRLDCLGLLASENYENPRTPCHSYVSNCKMPATL